MQGCINAVFLMLYECGQLGHTLLLLLCFGFFFRIYHLVSLFSTSSLSKLTVITWIDC